MGKQLSVQPSTEELEKTGISRNQLVEERGGSLVKGHGGPTPELMSSGSMLEGVEVECVQSIPGIAKQMRACPETAKSVAPSAAPRAPSYVFLRACSLEPSALCNPATQPECLF